MDQQDENAGQALYQELLKVVIDKIDKDEITYGDFATACLSLLGYCITDYPCDECRKLLAKEIKKRVPAIIRDALVRPTIPNGDGN